MNYDGYKQKDLESQVSQVGAEIAEQAGLKIDEEIMTLEEIQEKHFPNVPIEQLAEIMPNRPRQDAVPKLKDSGENQGSKRYIELLNEMKDLHIRKNAGYAGDSLDRWANFRVSESFGVPAFLGVMVRMSDKWIRITNLVNNPNNEKVGESIKDTLMDLASYALIAIAIMEEQDA